MKRIITLSICVLLSTALYSQITFIGKSGVSLSNITFNEDINAQSPGDFKYESKTGFMIGLAMEIPIVAQRFSIQPEVLFVQKGYKEKYDDSESSSSYKTTFNYLEIPAFARVNFGKFYVLAGPSIAFGLGGTYKGSDTSKTIPSTAEHEGKVKFGEEPTNYNGSNLYANAVDMGLQFGAGLNFKVIVIDVRYGLGLSDVFDENHINSNAHNRALQLTLGLPMTPKKRS